MILQIKRYLFWLFVENSKQKWYDYWLLTNTDEYFQFRRFVRNHEFYDDSDEFTGQDEVTMYTILSEYFSSGIESNFDIKFLIWLRN